MICGNYQFVRSQRLIAIVRITFLFHRLLEIVTVSNSIAPVEDAAGGEADKSGHIFGNCYKI